MAFFLEWIVTRTAGLDKEKWDIWIGFLLLSIQYDIYIL